MISELLGFDSDYIIIGLAAFVLILFIMLIINMVQTSKLKKKYNKFMSGKDGKSLEDILSSKIEKIDELVSSNKVNEKNINKIFHDMKYSYQKTGLVKYDAFHEMGGKLSFSVALLNAEDDGYVLNAVHSREGCYTYIKEIIGGNSVIMLADEEKEALEIAKAVEISKK